MSREKQIEKMIKAISTCACDCLNCKSCYSWELCEVLYNTGYRKQSEGEWYVNHMTNLFSSKRGRTIHYKTYTCSVCGKSNGRHTSNFCPFCGAKMKGGGENV